MSESLLVVERSSRSQIHNNPNFEELSSKTYGDTRILIYKYI
jgi:16S rRNA G966 N2-methylase RsmD